MRVKEKINRIVKVLDPAMRVPFVIAIDWFLSKYDFSNFYSCCKSLPAFVMLLLLLFVATHGNLLFMYGFFINLNIVIALAFLTIGEYFPEFQKVVLTTDGQKLFLDTLIFYQGLIFTFGIDNWLISNLRTPFFVIVLSTITGILCCLNYGFMLGFWYFMACEFFGSHKKVKQSLHELSYLVRYLGYLNTLIYYYRSKKITLVLRLFWVFAVAMNFLFETHAEFKFHWFLICTGAASNTSLRLFALSLWLPQVSYLILWIARGLLIWSVSHTAEDLEPRDMGKALVFYFIASVNSVLDVKVIQRVFFLSLMLFISFSFILQSVFKLCDKTLKSLSTSLQHNIWVHIRAIGLTLLLVWLLLHTSWMFCALFSFRVWQLVVVSSNVVTAVQALGSLAIYGLFVYDLNSQNSLEHLDDWVYYLNAVSNSLEFLSAFLVLSFGVWDVLQGIWSIFGLLVIVIHTYYNVWLAARNGWKIFLNRRTAVTKLNRLADATQEQLNDLQDLCAICFDSMSSAKITQCGHYFHSNCLRKWLYVQSSCPLCHQDVLISSNKED